MFWKKATAVILVFTIVLNIFGFGVFNVRASAVLAEAIGITILGLVSGIVIGGLSGLLGDELSDNQYKFYNQYEGMIDKINNKGIQNGELMQVNSRRNSDGTYTYWLEAAPNLTSDEQEFINKIISGIDNDKLNGAISGYLANQDEGHNSAGANISAHYYKELKDEVTNSLMEYLSAKGAIEVGEAGASSGDLPTYSFDFTGPTPGMTIPTSTGYTSLTTADGAYQLSVPAMLTGDDGQFASKNLTTLFGVSAELYGGNDTDGYSYHINFDESKGAYGWGRYIVFGGKIYYFAAANTVGSNLIKGAGYTFNIGLTLYTVKNRWYYSADGENLADAMSAKGVSSIVGLQCGLYFVKKPNVPGAPKTSLSDSDLTTTLGGGSIDVPRTDAENTIGGAISTGILPDDLSQIKLGIDELGNIVSANGIDINTLKQAVAGLQGYEQANANNIADIQANIAAIMEALTAERTNNLDFDIPDVTIIDKFPFSLPWDFYNIISILCAEPKEPVFTVPIKTTITNGGLNYEIDEEIELDLTIFRVNGVDIVRAITNSATILLAVICLISMTRKFIWK